MKKSKSIILLLAMVMILGISAASAADIDNTSDSDVLSVEEATIDEVVSADAVDEVATASNDAEVLSADGDGNFTELQTSVNTGMVMMDKDYARVEGENDISITKDVTILGNNHKIDANNLGGIFRINSGYTLTLIGVTLINGNSEYGGAIYNDGGSATIVNSYFLNNTAEKSGGAIYNNAGSMSITGSTFEGNDLTDRTVNGYGGAAIYSNGGTILLSGATVTNNLKDIVHRGGTGTYTGDLSSAAVSSTGSLTVSDSYFEKNSGSYGGAILSNGENAILRVVGSTFVDNFAFNGGAIDFVGNVYTISNCTFRDNKARGSGSTTSNYANGGAICAQESNGDSVIVDCIFENNSGVIGGAISNTDSKVTRCTFINNTAQASYSETFNGKTNNRGGFGAAIYSTENIVIEDSEFKDNLNTRKDCVHIQNAEITGSSFENTIINLNNKGTLTVANNTYDNDAKDIAGVSSSNVYIGEGQVPKVTSGSVYSQAATFTDLQAMVDSGTTSAIFLTNDITKLESEYDTFADGVIINSNVIINTNGYTITSNSGKVFTVNEDKTLTLRGADIVGDGTSAIDNKGQVTLGKDYTYTFTNVGEYAIDNKGTVYEASLTNFTQLADLIALVNGGDVYIGSSKITKSDKEKEAFADGIIIENDLTIRGFANTNGIISYIDAANSGRIFSVNDGATLTVDTFILKNGNADYGGAIYVESANALVVKNVELINNTAVYRGGAIYSEGTVEITDSIIKENYISKRDGGSTEDKGGAALFNNGGIATLDNVQVIDNLKDYVNGNVLDGAVVAMGETTITNSYFANNYGRYGGAITQTETDKTLTVENTTFEDNVAIFGAAIYDSGAPLVVKDCKFYNNSGIGPGSPGTSNSQGGAILVMGTNASADIKGSEFINNTADLGGAVSLAGADEDSIIDDCTFIENTATTNGGAVYYWSNTLTTDLEITDSTFTGNSASDGGAVYFCGYSDLVVTGSEFTDNTAAYGGAIENEGFAGLTVDDSKFIENTATTSGGAIISSGNTSVSNSVFADNEANVANTNAIYIYASDNTLALSNNTITGSDDAQILTKAGTSVITPLKVKILDNATYNIHMSPFILNATVTDDNDNLIFDYKFRFVVGDKVVDGIDIDTAGLYTATFTPTESGTFVVSTNLEDTSEVLTGTLNVYRTFTDLANIIAGAQAGDTIVLDGDYAYNPEFDADLIAGITIDKAITIDGNGYTISGNNTARIFKVTAATTIDNVTIADGYYSDSYGGAAIYATAALTATNTNFTNNGAADLIDKSVYGAVRTSTSASFDNCIFTDNYGRWGGAIGAEGSGTITIKNSKFENNKARQGGAIDIEGYTLNIDNTEFIGNDAVMLGGAVHTSQGTATTVTNSKFERNTDYQGGAICSKGSTGSLTVDNSEFIANEVTGTEMPNKETWSSGGAIWVENELTLTNSNFTANKAEYNGGAVYVQDGTVSATIDNCRFENNYAGVNYGAIVLYALTNTVSNSYFDNNSANGQANAITLNKGNLELSGNTITGVDSEILVKAGTLTSQINITVMDNKTQDINSEVELYAAVTDDNGNVITDSGFKFLVGTTEVAATFNPETKYYEATYNPTTLGEYVVNMTYTTTNNIVVKTATLRYIKGTFTDLANMIANVETGKTIVLDGDYTYDPEFDADLVDGIVIDKDIAIDGDGYTINGNNAARIFKVTGGNTLALTDASLVNGYAEYGGAIYVDASTLVLDNCTLDSNDVFDLTGSNPNELGGAAIHAVDSTVTITDSYITNNGDRTLDRSDNKVINGAVNLINSNTEITGTLFENNIGIYGGAVFAKGGSLEVSDSEFISNIAYVGAGIRTEGTTLTVTGSKFEENEGRGTGSEGTSKNSGAAICSNGVASISITSSNFTRNSAENGGAINTNVISSSNTVEIDNCIFTDNVATEKGGAILVNNDAAETIISNSNFTGNDGVFGSAIFNLKTLSLSKNNIDEAGAITSASVIASKVIITVLDNENATYNIYDKITDFYAQVTDDNGNVIVTSDKILKIGFGTSVLNLEYDETDGLYHKANVKVVKSGAPTLRPETKNLFTNITFESPYITAIKLNATLEVEYENVTDQDDVVIGITLTGKEGETAISAPSGSSKFTITVNNVPYSVKITKGIGSLTISDLPAGNYVINASWTGNTYYNPIEQLYNLTIGPKKGTFTDLQYIIDNDETGLVVLPYDFKYDSDYDADLVNGVVIDKNLYVLGNDYTIDANNSARIFNVTNGAIFKIDDATLTNGRADYGGAIYVDADSFLNTQNVVLYNNTATYRGGAIYSEGTVDVMDSVLDSNDITFRTKNDDNGGAAIYNLKGDLSISNSNITNNLKDIVIRNGNDGDLLVGVVVTSGYTFIEDSYFANNTGSWGGAISSLGYMNDESYLLSIKNSKFEGNNATFGGAIFVESSKLEVDNCTFENNKGLGVGSSGTSNTQGGAIIVHPAQSSVSITDSTFIGNSANVGAAVSLSRVDGDSIIENCTFTDNTASSEGGAIYGYTVGKLTVANSTFSGNTAPWGNAISNDGILVLSNNTVSGSSPDIANYYGTIESEMNIVILNNETVTFTGETLITAKVTDDNNNLIKDINFVFVVNETELEAKFNSTSGLYQAVYENDNAGFFVVNITYNEEENLVVKTGTLKNIKGTFTDLQNKVNAADNELSLSYNFTFVEGIDDALINGIVIDKAITISGNGYTINGNDTARILQLNTNGITIDNVTFTNGYADMDSTSSADWGGAIYSNGAYTNHIISNSRFYNNTAYNGGAIYLAGDDSKIINSTFEDNTANASGGAVFLFGWDCTIEGSNFTDNTANQLGGAVAMYSSHPAIIRESTFTKNIAGQNGGAVSWQRAAGSIFESTFIENEAGANGGAVFWDANPGSVAGSEFTGNIANGFGGAIFVNDNAGLTVASTFTENAALNGGAIAAFGDTTVYTSTFTENSAVDYGGAIFVNDGAELDIKQSTIKDNTATVGNSIYVMDGTVDSSIINATILDNKTWDDTDLGDIYILNATLTDDNGNMIYDPSFRFTVDGTVIEDVPLYDDETGLYTIPYYIGTAGPKVVSTNYDAENLEIFTGILDVPKANITEFTVLTMDTLEGENATIWITLIGVNDQGLNSTVTVIVNNKEYAVPVENGEGNLTVEGLTHGQYPVVAMFDDPSYNPAINSSVFFVKGKSVLNITELTVAEYGDVIEIAINLTGSDGKPLTGVVVVDDVINVLVENGIGTFVIDNQPDVGNYTFQAVYDGDNDYFGDLAIFNVTINTKVIDPEDIVVDIPNINEFGEAIPITITSPVDGTYTVNINGTPVEVEVVNGVGNATITLDKPGIYNATVDIADEGYSLETITTDEFEYLVTPEFNVEITGTYPEAEISIIGPAGTYHITIDGMEPVDITREESGLPSLVTITDMDAGNYTAFVSFDARDEYYGDYKEINFTVNKAALDIEEPEVIGDKVIESPINITFTLPADVDPSSVSAFMDGTPVPIDEFVVNETTGVYTLPLDGFSDAVGHLFSVEVNDPNYEEDGAQVTFTIEKVETTVTIKVNESEIGVMGGSTVNVTVSNNAAGYLVIDNNGVISVVEITNGTYSFEIYDLQAGEYYINATFLGNDKYLKSNATKVLNIPKSSATPEITDVTVEVTLGEDASVLVDMNNDFVSGNITVFVDGVENQTVDLDDYGTALVTIPGLTIGDHTIGVKYNGNDNFNASDIVAHTINVGKAGSKVTIDPIDNVTYGEEVFILYTVDNQTNVVITVFDNTGIITPVMETADGIIGIKDLKPGDYQIMIENEESDEYKESYEMGYFTVGKAASSVTIVEIDDLVYPGTGEVLYEIENKTEEQLIILTFNGAEIEVQYDNESIQLTDLAAGEYTLTIINVDDDLYNESEASITFKVLKADPRFTSEVDVGAKVGENVTITVIAPADATGNVSLAVDGEIVAIEVPVVNGTAIINVTGLAAGHHSYDVSYAGDDNYNSATDVNSFDVAKAETTVTIEVEGALGVMGGATVNVTVSNNVSGYLSIDNDGTVSVVEITNGTYSFDIYDLTAGDYNITVTFLGNDNYLKSNATKVLNIPKSSVTPEISESTPEITLGEYAVVLVDIGDNFATGNVTIFVDGVENQTVALDESYGMAMAIIPGLTTGNHTIGVRYNGDSNYNASGIVNTTVKVDKADSKVTIGPIGNVTYGEEVFILYTVENQTNVKITVYDNSGEITPVMETADGIIGIKGLKPGDYQIMIENEENDEYKSNYTMGYFTVGKADSTVTIDPIDNVTYGEEVMILYNVDNQTNVKIIVYHADEIIEPEMVTEDGLITIKGLTPGNYEIYIENEESDEYKGSLAMGEFTVGKAASSVTIVEIDDFVYPGTGEVLYEIKNKTEDQSIIVTFNGNVIVVPYDEDSIELTDLAAGEYTITIKNLENDLYNGSEAAISFKVVKANPTFTSNVTENAKVGENVTITVQAPADATGNVTVVVDGEIIGEITLTNGVASVNVTGLAAGHHSYEVTYAGDDNYEIASDLNSFDVVKVAPEIIISDPENPVVGNLVHATVTVADGDATGYIIFNKVAYKLDNGQATIDVGISEAGTQVITVEYLGDDKYANGSADKAFTAAKAPTEITLRDETLNTVVDREVEVVYTINPMVSKGNVSLWIDDELYYNEEISLYTGSIVISGEKFKNNGTYIVKVQYIGTDDYADSENATLVVNVEDETVVINITVPENTTVPVFNITVPSDATGLLLVDIDGKHYYAPVENGTASITVPGLEPGNYTANVTYTGDEFYDPATKTVEFTVPANADENSITIPEGATTTNPTFSIDLPSDATGYFEVDVDGKKYVVPVENGTAKISVPGLAPGNHNVTVKYSGDSKYNSISKSTTLKLKEPVPKLSENKYIKVVYSGKATYKVRLTLDGKAAAGKYVTINYNGKNYNVKTDSKGYATLKLNTKVKPKKYTVTATYKGVKVTSKVKVKHVIKAKNKKAKKSKKLNLYVKLKKVDGKVLKNKKVKLKFKGKKYTAKTNKKGKAKFTIKKKVMQKLKKGKKYKYKVYYGKDKVTKKIKVKK